MYIRWIIFGQRKVSITKSLLWGTTLKAWAHKLIIIVNSISVRFSLESGSKSRTPLFHYFGEWTLTLHNLSENDKRSVSVRNYFG